MAFSYLIVFVALLHILKPITATYNSSIDSYLANLCREVECGKGTCKASLDYTFNFICECDSGWTQVSKGEEDDGHSFLPCIYPNCTMNYSCGEAPAPTPNVEEPPTNKSFYDPCYWTYCGDGSCSPTSGHGYKCDCKQGYTNLMNSTAFPCFGECVIGSDCTGLGVTVPVSIPSSVNNAYSIIPRSFPWAMVFTFLPAIAPQWY
ncbi:hypothetical protein IFM89_013739 [Coptis chinensis]|uniref:EGF-like domain-containing protein n=1 Tax=Coptis chinensis TaxID=261450 RepID=A0A835HTI0_9MAGN|nr:hypothetical protein IFM89_013739 [Coptis chinensis]